MSIIEYWDGGYNHMWNLVESNFCSCVSLSYFTIMWDLQVPKYYKCINDLVNNIKSKKYYKCLLQVSKEQRDPKDIH